MLVPQQRPSALVWDLVLVPASPACGSNVVLTSLTRRCLRAPGRRTHPILHGHPYQGAWLARGPRNALGCQGPVPCVQGVKQGGVVPACARTPLSTAGSGLLAEPFLHFVSFLLKC